MILRRHSAIFMSHMLNNEKILFRVIFRKPRRKLTDLQILCVSASFLLKSPKLTQNVTLLSLIPFFQLKGKWKEKGRVLNGSYSVKRKFFLGGDIKPFHSAKFRFTHVYIHASLNLEIKPSIS